MEQLWLFCASHMIVGSYLCTAVSVLSSFDLLPALLKCPFSFVYIVFFVASTLVARLVWSVARRSVLGGGRLSSRFDHRSLLSPLHSRIHCFIVCACVRLICGSVDVLWLVLPWSAVRRTRSFLFFDSLSAAPPRRWILVK